MRFKFLEAVGQAISFNLVAGQKKKLMEYQHCIGQYIKIYITVKMNTRITVKCNNLPLPFLSALSKAEEALATLSVTWVLHTIVFDSQKYVIHILLVSY